MICSVLSVMAHMGGVIVATDDAPNIEMAGAAPAPARLGNSFQDIAAGSATSVSTPSAEAAESAVEDAVVSPNVPAEVVPPIATNAATIPATADLSSVVPTVPGTPTDPTDPTTVLPQSPLSSVLPITPTELVTGEEPVSLAAATADTIRPRPRPEPTKVVPETQPERQPESGTADNGETSPPASSPGVAETERRGVAEGVETGASNDAGDATGTATEAGNAAASSYPGAVMRKINRTRKPRVGVQGTAIVGFEIRSDGGLATVTILRTSGEAAVDQAALDHLRRAAPFPTPPTGAERRFQVEYVSRG